ncbi:hypothetical protein A9179_09450 [Pseudomonas alcaligenes]|uniref:protein-glutamate methylesterase n=2 Tax=Pseudomonadaceae TaxID=135621 RepID=A0A1V0LZU3_ECTOL|nr:chemotaxis protein CheB [Pseudomonas alcaligenes]ARD68204.1 Chemotaxis response regulator protein glutamate methylesterase [Pseudomonas oleovorans]MBC9250496.1 hypothetical protein [Pseudomonas alcaligenes]
MRVLIVDDSVVTRMLLRSVLENEGYQVEEAGSGEQALQVLQDFLPDIVTMDVHMPGMDGYETTERILERHALPVVVLTASANPHDSATAMRALSAGALAVLDKPTGPAAEDFDERMAELLRTLRSMVQVKIVRRQLPVVDSAQPAHAEPVRLGASGFAPQLVAIAASAGGPPAVKAILQGLRLPQPWPLVLVQHIAPGFLPSFRDWLASLSPLPVCIAEDGQALAPGHLYLAPDGCHLGFAANRHVRLDDGPPEEHIRPAANHLFRTVAKYFGRQAVAIQLSGMGRDGAQGMLELSRAGCQTLVQEPGSALIDSMPKAVIALQAASQVLTPEDIATYLNTLAEQVTARTVKERGD